jgi:hypothetical protein
VHGGRRCCGIEGQRELEAGAWRGVARTEPHSGCTEVEEATLRPRGGGRGRCQHRCQGTAPPQVAQGLAAPEQGEQTMTSAEHVEGARSGRRLSTWGQGEGGRAEGRGRQEWAGQVARAAATGATMHGGAKWERRRRTTARSRCAEMRGRCRRARGRQRRCLCRAGGPWSKQIAAARCRWKS